MRLEMFSSLQTDCFPEKPGQDVPRNDFQKANHPQPPPAGDTCSMEKFDF
jgi:hypothetical protein